MIFGTTAPLGANDLLPPGHVNVVDNALDFAPAEKAVRSFVTQGGQGFWGVEEACTEHDG